MNITPFLYIPFVAWAIAQLIKFSIALVKRGEVDFRYLYASGGMPSVHSAVVCSLATWALIDGGVGSPLFGITAVFAAIVMYDSFGVRRSTGEQAGMLNKLIRELRGAGALRSADEFKQLREILGHQPLEVLVGASLGIAIACGFGYEKLSAQFPTFFSSPNSKVAIAVMIIGAIFIVTAPFKYLFLSKKYKKNKAVRNAGVYVILINALFGVALALYGLMVFEGVYADFTGLEILSALVFVWLVLTAIFGSRLVRAIRSIPKAETNQRKSQWLKKSKPSNNKKKKKK